MKKLVALLFTTLLFSIHGFSQEQSKKQVSNKKWIYEFHVSGMTSIEDAEKLDKAMIHMLGIYSSTTDFNTKMIIVSCLSGIDYAGLRLIVQSVGLVADDNYLLKEKDIAASENTE